MKTQELLAKCKQNIVIYEKAQSAVKNIQLLDAFRLNIIKRRNDLVNYKIQLNFFISKFSNYRKHLLVDFFFKCNEKILLFDIEISNIYCRQLKEIFDVTKLYKDAFICDFNLLLLNAKKELNSLNLVFEELQGLQNKEIINMEDQKVKSKEPLDNFLSKRKLLFDILLKNLKQQELFSFNILRKMKKKYTMALNVYGNSFKELKEFSSFLVENFMNKFPEVSKEEVFAFSLNPFIIEKYEENLENDYVQLQNAKKKVHSANRVACKEAFQAVQQAEKQFSQFSISDAKKKVIHNFVQKKIFEIQDKMSIAFEQKVKAEQTFVQLSGDLNLKPPYIDFLNQKFQSHMDLELASKELESLNEQLNLVANFIEKLDSEFKNLFQNSKQKFEQSLKIAGYKESFVKVIDIYREALNAEHSSFIPHAVEMFT